MTMLRPLCDRRIALLWVAQILSATGSEFYMVAVVWLASSTIGRDAGYVSAAQSAALLGGSLLGGVLSDGINPSTIMFCVGMTRCALLLMLSFASYHGGADLYTLVAIAAMVALVTALFNPCLQSTLAVLVVDPSSRHAVNGLFDSTRRIARILGPSLIASVSSLIPVNQFFVVTAVTFLLSALGVRESLKDFDALPAAISRSSTNVYDAITGGFVAIRSHRIMYYGLLSDFLNNILWSVGMVLGLALRLRESSADPIVEYGVTMTAYGVGNLISNVVLSGIPPKRPLLWFVLSNLTFGLGMMAMPISHHLWLIAFAGVAAINGPLGNLALLHIIQQDFPVERVAQIFRLKMCVVFLGMLFGNLAAPTLFHTLGIGPTISAIGALAIAVGLLGLLWKDTLASRARSAD